MKLGKLALGGTAVMAIIAAVIVIRTASFTPENVANAADIKLAAIPDYDIAQAAAHLGQATRFQTVSHQDIKDNDLTQWAQLHNWLQTAYPASHSAMSREFAAENTLVYTWKGSDTTLPPIVLMAHQDVVPVTEGSEKDWTHPPFSGELADNAIWGRGTVDDKGSLVALMEAVDGLVQSGFKPKRTLYIVSGHDEEAGGTGAKAAAAMLSARGVKALFTIDEGSATVLDAPVVNGPAILIGVAEKGYATLKVTANAIGGHSSMPPKETGVVNLAKAIIAINDNGFPLEVKGPGAQMLGSLAVTKGGLTKVAMANLWAFAPLIKKQAGGTPAGAAMLHTTIAPTMLLGSPKENVLPQSATGLINYRIAPWNSSADIMAKAKSAVGSMPVELSWVNPPREPSKVSSTNSPGWKYIAATAHADMPTAPIAPYLVVAGTDSRSFQDVSQDVYRYQPLHFRVEETKMIHGTNEHMTLDNLKRSIIFYARLIATSAG